MAELKAYVGNFKGPKGDTGVAGATGPQGPKGATGATGPQGPKGNTGATGPQGSKGDTGATGATGPQGSKGATGTRGSQFYNGTGITGTSTTAAVFSSSGVSAALAGDYYINTGTGADRGRVYRCTTAGAASTAKWVYSGTLIGPQGPQGIQGPVGPAGPNSADLISITDTSGMVGAAGAEVASQALIDAIADKVMTKLLAKSQVVNNLLATVAGNVLDATQGKALKDMIDTTNSNLMAESTYILPGVDYFAGTVNCTLRKIGNQVDMTISVVNTNQIPAVTTFTQLMPAEYRPPQDYFVFFREKGSEKTFCGYVTGGKIRTTESVVTSGTWYGSGHWNTSY